MFDRERERESHAVRNIGPLFSGWTRSNPGSDRDFVYLIRLLIDQLIAADFAQVLDLLEDACDSLLNSILVQSGHISSS